jgi:hypothetical protein
LVASRGRQLVGLKSFTCDGKTAGQKTVAPL